MNDFTLTLIDWSDVIDRFTVEKSRLLIEEVMADGDFETAAATAQDFLYSVTSATNSINARELSPLNTAMESVKIWSAFGSTYSVLRGWIPHGVATQFDGIYLPILGHWAVFDPSLKPLFQFPPVMNNLKMGGLAVAISPDHCRLLASNCRSHSFSYLIHWVACHTKGAFSLPMSDSWFNPLFDVENAEMMELHASYTEATEGWRKLILEAVRQGKGVVSVLEI